jgi:hypothetical protein
MSEAKDELRRTLREAAAAGQGTHPEPDELAAYQAGELAGEAKRRLEDHLVACPACAALLLDLDGLADPGFGAGRPGAAAERDAAWESFRAQIANTAPEVRGRFAPPPAPRWLYALAATLLLAVGALSFEMVSLSQHNADLAQKVAALSRPEGNTPVVDLFQGIARGAQPSTPAPIAPSGARSFTLVLHADPLPSYREYGVEILDATGRLLSRERGLQPQMPYRLLTLGVPRETLGAGSYQVRLFGIDGSSTVTIGRYALPVLP